MEKVLEREGNSENAQALKTQVADGAEAEGTAEAVTGKTCQDQDSVEGLAHFLKQPTSSPQE